MRKNQMQYNWGLFLEAAKRWLNDMQDDEDETLIRCGISRAYYAAFHVCQQYLIILNILCERNIVPYAVRHTAIFLRGFFYVIDVYDNVS